MKRTLALIFTLTIAAVALSAQDRLKLMPGYDNYTKMQPQLTGAVVPGTVQALQWTADGTALTYTSAGKAYRLDFATMTPREVTVAADPAAAPPAGGGRGAGRAGGVPPAAGRGGGQGQGGMEQAQREMPVAPMQGCPAGGPARGRQGECVMSPDGKFKAFYRARNFWVANADGTGEVQVTTDGSVEKRIKNGSGSWVYGEELGQTTAIWWAPDSKRVGYYRFDESPVQDFFLQMNQTGIQSVMDIEAYPKAGAPNPIPEVFVYDISAGASKKLDVRDGRPWGNDVVGHYVYAMRWSPDGTELMMNRTNRRQQVLEFVACSPATAKCRVIIREEWLTGWVDNRPGMTMLKDNKRFLWQSDRNGFNNYYLYDLTGKLINPVTKLTTAEAAQTVKLDEDRGVMFYMARDGDNWMKMQLHRVNLDGTGDVRLTDPKFNHTVGACATPGGGGGGRAGGAGGPGGAAACGISADNKFFVDVYQTHNTPAATQLVDMTGKVLAQLAKADTTKFTALGLKKAEQFTYLSADGKTTLFGQISFPSNFDPSKKWPTLVPVYGGPASGSNVPTENFANPVANAEYGFLVVNLGSRSAPGQGKRTLDQVYMNLGVAEMDDMANGIKALYSRPYFDKDRVGMYGTSYGGTTSVLMILRHPDVVTVASSSSPVTSWHHYDSVYTERYMWIPQENPGYEKGSAMNLAANLKGRLLLYYGTADNNVHPNNTMQLITALQRAGKSFEVQVGPDQPHTGVNGQRMMEFFIENLVMRPERVFGK
jgi:dipeptidyl-peptidase-4